MFFDMLLCMHTHSNNPFFFTIDDVISEDKSSCLISIFVTAFPAAHTLQAVILTGRHGVLQKVIAAKVGLIPVLFWIALWTYYLYSRKFSLQELEEKNQNYNIALLHWHYIQCWKLFHQMQQIYTVFSSLEREMLGFHFLVDGDWTMLPGSMRGMNE